MLYFRDGCHEKSSLAIIKFMSQSSSIAAFLLVGFIVFITIRGDIKSWREIIGI